MHSEHTPVMSCMCVMRQPEAKALVEVSVLSTLLHIHRNAKLATVTKKKLLHLVEQLQTL